MNNIIYQISLRTLTPEGTLRSAIKMLPHIALLGVDYIYLTACWAVDNDLDKSTWSPRQKASECENPKNPYKMSDYFHVDEEYGTDEDLHEFVEAVHENGMKLMFDLVYLHCGRNAVFIEDHPDFVQRNDKGEIDAGEDWPFARLNYDSRELREYLYSNMEYLVKEYNIDGFRCDVGFMIPADFWEEGIKRIRAIKPDIYMLLEAEKECHDYFEGGFDINYYQNRYFALVRVYREGGDLEEYKKFFEDRKYIHRYLNFVDNHDEASDVGLNRNEVFLGTDGTESMIVITFTMPGVPYLWNGMEVCDDLENCMFSNRFYGKRNNINWANALTEKGKERISLIKTLVELYHTHEALNSGDMEFVEMSGRLLCFTRSTDNEKIFVCINTENKPAKFMYDEDIDIIMRKGTEITGTKYDIEGYGYLIGKIKG